MTHLTTPLKPRFKQAPAHRPRLADDIYEQILSAILEGDIVPGERMVQESVAREINVSRTPVRELYMAYTVMNDHIQEGLDSQLSHI